MTKRKIGRPKLGNDVKRYKAVIVRLREGEYEELKARAAEAEVSVAHYIREHCLGRRANDVV